MPSDRTNTLTTSKWNALSAALLVIGAVAMYNWTLRPHLGYLRAVQRLEPVVSETAVEKDRVCTTLDAKRLALRTLQQELVKAHAEFFTNEESKAFVRHLQSLVEETGCTVLVAVFAGDSARQAQEPERPVGLRASHVSLTVQGQYDQIVGLLEKLRSNRQKVWVDSCRMERSGTTAGQLKCQLALTTYTVLDPGEPNR